MGRDLIVLSNREPYRHDRTSKGIVLSRPVSGLVSALEPVMNARSGLWIAQGTGSADAETASFEGELAVPPGSPRYTLRRVFLSVNQTQGHTDGFSNQALWPLCHVAHQRPVFKTTHWQSYEQVNRMFADAVMDRDLAKDPFVLIHDYHLALVPRLIRDRAQHARVAIFWHVPWPPAEIFARCPWAVEILQGMLGARLIAFHTEEYCTNFLATCERLLEARISWQDRSIQRVGITTRVRSVPVGIEPEPFHLRAPAERAAFWRDRHGLTAPRIALSVDRIDFTKGILERMEALALLLDANPQLRGALSLVQIAPPCRPGVAEYRELAARIEERTREINHRFGGRNPAIHWLSEPRSWQELAAHYQMADLCVVSPLHDGMNLVAKEYVWCQHHESGSLVLSRFAGAAHELSEAWLVNPHDTDGFARTLERAILEPEDERRGRMRELRAKVLRRTSNAWADSLLHELVQA